MESHKRDAKGSSQVDGGGSLWTHHTRPIKLESRLEWDEWKLPASLKTVFESSTFLVENL